MAEGGKPTFGGETGATLRPEYMGRTMKCYPVHETEMESLSGLNTEATLFFSAGSASFAFAVGILTNATFADHLTPTAEVATRLGAPVLLVLAAFLAILGAIAIYRRGSIWRKIRSEAVTLQAVPADQQPPAQA